MNVKVVTAHHAGVIKQPEIHRLLNISGEYFYRDDHKPTAYNRICKASISKAVKVYVATMSGLMMCFVLAALGPVHRYFQDGTKVTLQELHLPYFNKDPSIEFIIRVIWEMFCNLVGGISYLFMEATLCIVNDTVSVSAELCALDLCELSNYIEENGGMNEQSNRMLNDIFRRIVFMDE